MGLVLHALADWVSVLASAHGGSVLTNVGSNVAVRMCHTIGLADH